MHEIIITTIDIIIIIIDIIDNIFGIDFKT